LGNESEDNMAMIEMVQVREGNEKEVLNFLEDRFPRMECWFMKVLSDGSEIPTWSIPVSSNQNILAEEGDFICVEKGTANIFILSDV